MKSLLVTIDGPAGAGKTTVSRLLAEHLGYTYVDTGALYRAVALAALSENCSIDNDAKLGEICSRLRLRFRNTAKGLRLYMNEADITDDIRTEEIGMFASAASAKAAVRECLLGVQREMGKDGGAVFEGRDMGTVVFPQADIKFFLDAEPSVRAFRRHKELARRGASTTLGEVRAAMLKRDEDDSKRALSPLKAAPDAIRVDTSSLQIEEVVELMARHISARAK